MQRCGVAFHGHERTFSSADGNNCIERQDHATDPCFGHLLENGWSVNDIDQMLTHGSGISIPIELQNKSMLLRGWVRMIKDKPPVLEPFSIRAVRAEIFNELSEMRVG